MSYAYQTVPLMDREQLAQWYSLDAAGEAAAFLDTHPALTPLLLAAYPVLVQHFPQGEMSLRVTHDPEGWDWSELVAAINPGCEPTEALERLEQFDQAWESAGLDQAQGVLFFHVEYR
ncbi:MAG: hypothetical protein M3Z04_25600 [Chloroflexota bacterium]|nr:hypothetical protein [Chloroflexota bacterium]